MAEQIKQSYRNKVLALKEQLESMPTEDLLAFQKQRQSTGGALGRGLQTASNLFLQQGDLKPAEQSGESDLNKLIMREKVKSMFKEPKEEKPSLQEILQTVGGENKDFPIGTTMGVDTKEGRINLPLGPSLEQVKNEEKKKAAELKKAEVTEKITSSAQDMLNTIKNVKEGARYFGPLGQLPTQATPEGMGAIIGINKEGYEKRKKWENSVNRLLAQKGLDMMLELKNASKTGATGFGQLSEKEGQWLKDASTELTRDIGQERALEILNEMERLYTKILSGGVTPAQTENLPTNTGQQMSGGQVMVDAQGNKAMVYPDGSYEEIQ